MTARFVPGCSQSAPRSRHSARGSFSTVDEPPSVWRPVAAYAGLSAANQMLWLTYTPITTDAARHYGVSSGAIGWYAEIFPLLYVVLAVPAGKLIDRRMPFWLGVGALLTAAGGVLRLAADDYAVVLAGQCVVAVAQPLVLNAVTKVSGSYLRERDRASGIAVSSAASSRAWCSRSSSAHRWAPGGSAPCWPSRPRSAC